MYTVHTICAHIHLIVFMYMYSILFVVIRYNNKTYRVDDINWKCTPQDTFKLHSGEDITYIDYYKRVSVCVCVCVCVEGGGGGKVCI